MSDKQQDIAYENSVVREKLKLIDIEAEKIRKHMMVTDKDIKMGRRILGGAEASFTVNKLQADYLLYSADQLRLKWVEMMRDKPYFCRIDWNENGEEPATYYIGKVGMCKTDDYTPIVVDWRAPIANLYYDGRLGYAEYSAPDGTFTGDLSLKRQLEIENGCVRSVTDIDITTTDTMLQGALSKSADDRLKDIVVTIQSEQNRIIRDKPEGVLVVQGVAGSGKTTIVLHRVAYLIYHSEGGKGLRALIIAPNKLFLNYISNVLPELGVEDIQQATFTDLALGSIPEKLPFVQSSNLQDEDDELAIYKGSLEFKELIDRYIDRLESTYVPKADFIMGGQTVLTYDQIYKIYKRDCQYLPLMRRVREIEKRIKKRAKQVAEMITEAKNAEYENKLNSLRFSGELTPEIAARIYDERDTFAGELSKEMTSAIKSYIKQYPDTRTADIYISFITDADLLVQFGVRESLAKKLVRSTTGTAGKIQLTESDMAALVYLDRKLNLRKETAPYDLVVVDEGQDLSEFQYYIIRMLAQTGSFTIAGDLNQAIFTKGVSRWDVLKEKIFDDMDVRTMTLKKSYRTTVEIMDLANAVISRLGTKAELAEPVLRHGEKPLLIHTKTLQETAASISQIIPKLIDEQYKSIGIICKSLSNAKALHKILRGNIHLVTSTDTSYHGGVSILPAPLCKGLEFDVSIIADTSDYSDTPKDIRLLYVVLTRALHKLIVYNSESGAILQSLAGYCTLPTEYNELQSIFY